MNSEKEFRLDQIIAKYLNKELSLEEQHKLALWLEEDEKNRVLLQELEKYWSHYSEDTSVAESEVEERVLNRLKLMSTAKETKVVSIYPVWMKVAAAFIPFLIGLFVFFQIDFNDEKLADNVQLIEKISEPGQKLTTVLPDGTKVRLNSGSKLIVPEEFVGGTREVTLSGEAFFDVKRDESRPFIIKTENLNVRVLGTSFNVSAHQNSEKPSVSVKSGKVAVNESLTNQEVILEADQMVSLESNTLKKSAIAEEADPFGWISQRLVFNDASFSSVVEKIELWYGVKVQIKTDATFNMEYTASLNNPSLKHMMDLLAYVYEFKYQYDETNGEVMIF